MTTRRKFLAGLSAICASIILPHSLRAEPVAHAPRKRPRSDARDTAELYRGGDSGARIFKLVEDGTGSPGDKDNPCTFKYDVYDPRELIGEGVELTGRGRRNDVGRMMPASWGIGDVHADGSVRLVFADEANVVRCRVRSDDV